MAYEIIQNGTVIGISETITHIFYGKNEAYQSCNAENADGFCAKLPKEITSDDITDLTDNDIIAEENFPVDIVFALPGHTLKGDESEAEYREIIEIE